MVQLFLTLWFKLPWGWRQLLIGVPIVIGFVATLVTFEWIPIAAGAFGTLVLFLLPGPSQAEKNGYNF